MGARPYHPATGLFLGCDPIEGWCANDYMYVHGDLVNSSDLDGRGKKEFCSNSTVRTFMNFSLFG
jgi:hypothetical protein